MPTIKQILDSFSDKIAAKINALNTKIGEISPFVGLSPNAGNSLSNDAEGKLFFKERTPEEIAQDYEGNEGVNRFTDEDKQTVDNFGQQLIDIDAIEEDIQTIFGAIAEPPVYVAPTSSLTNIGGIYETGRNLQVNLTQTFNQNDAGAKISEKIFKDEVEVSNTNTYSETLVVPEGNTVFSGEVTYAEGACKVNNLGNEDCTGHIEPGTTVSAERIIRGKYPTFFFTSDNQLTAAQVAAQLSGATKLDDIDSNGDITVNFNANSPKYLIFAIPQDAPSRVRWYENDENQGQIGNVGDLFPSEEIIAFDSPDNYWANTNYRVYVSGYATQIGQIQLRR